MPASAGLSSTSLLFHASWEGTGGPGRGAFVARMAPENQAVPVFPRYDLPGQYTLIEQVAARCQVPLPRLRWNQPDGGPLGIAFFVMDQVDGRVPLDNPPYVFGGWLAEATDDERAGLERASVGVLAQIHAIPGPAAAFPALAPPPARPRCGTTSPGSAPTTSGRWPPTACAPAYRAGLRWLEEHWPAESGPVLCWGDARIGNISTTTSRRPRCSTGRWPGSARASSTWPGCLRASGLRGHRRDL